MKASNFSLLFSRSLAVAAFVALAVPAVASPALASGTSAAKIRLLLDYDPVTHTKTGEVVSTLENPQGLELIYAVNEPAKPNGICYEGSAEQAVLILEKMVETFKGGAGKDLKVDGKEVIDRLITKKTSSGKVVEATVQAIRVKVSESFFGNPERESWYLPSELGARPCK